MNKFLAFLGSASLVICAPCVFAMERNNDGMELEKQSLKTLETAQVFIPHYRLKKAKVQKKETVAELALTTPYGSPEEKSSFIDTGSLITALKKLSIKKKRPRNAMEQDVNCKREDKRFIIIPSTSRQSPSTPEFLPSTPVNNQMDLENLRELKKIHFDPEYFERELNKYYEFWNNQKTGNQ